MFTWYQNAKVCIAYLGDVTGPRDWHRSEWFSRGWTLQELLAPQRLKFFVKGWKPLTDNFNDKRDDEVLQVLRAVTGIPVDDLENFEPSTDRIREKLNWASKRKTTRVEDMAYCLIGILDVSLSISYGEGQRAFYSAIAAGPECFSRYPADAKAITNIQLMVAADMASEDVWSEWQQFCASNYI
ncbi:hypothetical protein SERLA73DRAFT_147444, partial [Serpula lacrymans var. lacrymans S7.3]